MNEFDLIYRYFNQPGLVGNTPGLELGIGDDCAVVAIESDQQLVQSIDTHVAGVHFPPSAPAGLIAYRALAAALSDLAAMGASPHTFYLALTLPKADAPWLEAFSRGLSSLAKEAGIVLAGGDTTRGSLAISVMVQGMVPAGQALTRSGAQVGDNIYVSGTLGDAAAGLQYALAGLNPDTMQDADQQYLLNRFYRPTARLDLGQWLLTNGATSAIDISDGLLADLGHILKASQVAASLNLSAVPQSDNLRRQIKDCSLEMSLTGGEDFELCFTLPASLQPDFPDGLQITHIGQIGSGQGITDQVTGQLVEPGGYSHF